MQDSNPGIDAEKDDTRTRLIGAQDKEATIRIDTPVSDGQTPSPEPTPSADEPRRSKAWIYVIIALVVIAAGAVAAFLLLGNDDKGDDKTLTEIESDEVPGVNNEDMGDFLNTAMSARYDKGADEAVAVDTVAMVEAVPAVADSAAVVW